MNPVNERLLRLETNVRELRRFRQRYTLEEVRQEPHLEWSLRYGLLEAIQSCLEDGEFGAEAPPTESVFL
ncbi:hypothetical protein [Thermoflexus hugenholtzii]